MLVYLIILFYVSGIMSFVMNRSYLLVMLLSLEFVVVSLYLNLMYYFSYLSYEFFFIPIFLTMSVCEGVLGLAILVMVIRVHGNDQLNLFSSLW